MFTMAVRKQLTRNPVSDDEISASLVWVQEMIHSILVGSESAGFDFNEDDLIIGIDEKGDL